jgi:phenylacetate-CoA ligase
MPALDAAYRHSPVFVQNIISTGYGLKERLLRYGGDYKNFVHQLEQSQWWSREELEAYQNARLQKLIKFCAQEVPHYQEVFSSLGLRPEDIRTPADLAQLPILEKETVRDDPERFIPRRLNEKRLAQTTGGTTGRPLHYFVTPSAVQYNYAVYETRFRNWAGVKFGERMASINGKAVVPIEANEGPFWRSNLAFNQLYLSAYHLSDKNLPHYIRRLQEFNPRVIVGYVSTVHTIARYIIDNNLFGLIRPKAVLVSSETLFAWLRADIESAFECKVFDGYSLGEPVVFISECEAGSLHVSPEYGVLETIEINENLEMVCTGLTNYAMPLVRYRTGDVVELAKTQTCLCGRQLPLVKSILGRIDDRVVTPEGTVVGPAPLSLAFQSVSNLKDAQIYQETPQAITLSISVAEAFSDRDEQFMLSELRKRLGRRLLIKVVRVSEIGRTSGGKQRLVISKIKANVGLSLATVGSY